MRLLLHGGYSSTPTRAWIASMSEAEWEFMAYSLANRNRSRSSKKRG